MPISLVVNISYAGAVALAARFQPSMLRLRRPRKLRGAFMIEHAIYRDWRGGTDDLARSQLLIAPEHGIVWPQGSSSVNTLTKEE
jgi:hypothetical protein